MDILPSDGAEPARRATALLDDPRVMQWHDPAQRTGRAFAETLDVQDLAWDVYLLYGEGAPWSDPAPSPAAWFHQLGGDRAEPSRRRSGHELAVALHETARKAGFPVSGAPPDEADFAAARERALERLRAPEESDVRCATCAAAERLTSCSLGGWTRLVARAEGDGTVTVSGTEPASPAGGWNVLRLRLSGLDCPECMLRAAAGPIALDGIEEVEVVLDAARMRVLFTPVRDADVDAALVALRAQRFGAVAEPHTP